MFDIEIETFRRWLKLLKDEESLAIKKPHTTRTFDKLFRRLQDSIKSKDTQTDSYPSL